jgi:hypothetical protein
MSYVQKPLTSQRTTYRILGAAWDPLNLPSAEAIAWDGVLRLVGPSNVGALVYVLTEPLRSSMPEEVRAVLEQAFFRTAAANTRCLHQLEQVGAVLASTGAPLLLLKGAALAETLYPDPALRRIGDIDLAVPTEWVGPCREALLAQGYSPSRIEERPGSLLAHTNQEQFRPPESDEFSIELHWHILDVPYYMQRVPMGWFWEHSEPLIISRQPYQVLSAEANVLYLSAHLALHHGFRGLHSLLDLALLIIRQADRLDWGMVMDAAREFELVSALAGTLDHLAEAWPSLPLDEPRQRLYEITPTRIDARLYRLLTSEARTPTLQFYAALVSTPGLGAKVRHVASSLLPQPAYMRKRYGFRANWQLPFWYFRRLGEGLSRLGRTIVHARRLSG